MSDQTCSKFHEAKMKLASAMEDFKIAAEEDERDVKEELLEEIDEVFGIGFVEGEQ